MVSFLHFSCFSRDSLSGRAEMQNILAVLAKEAIQGIKDNYSMATGHCVTSSMTWDFWQTSLGLTSELLSRQSSLVIFLSANLHLCPAKHLISSNDIHPI
jgi:hypothetical protein